MEETKTQAKLAKAAKPSNFVQTARAKKTPGKSVKIGGIQVIKGKGKKAVPFERGGLHESLNIPQDQKIPMDMMRKSLAGDFGEKAKKQANMARHMLAQGRATAASNK